MKYETFSSIFKHYECIWVKKGGTFIKGRQAPRQAALQRSNINLGSASFMSLEMGVCKVSKYWLGLAQKGILYGWSRVISCVALLRVESF